MPQSWASRSENVLLPQKGISSNVDITAESLHNLKYPIDWDGLPGTMWAAGDFETVLGRRMEARIQVNNRKSCGRHRPDRAVLHDTAGVY